MKINLTLLKDLYRIPHPSSNECMMLSYILNYCYSIDNLTFEIDHYGNLFITKNVNDPDYYPCLVAHMDEVFEYNENKGIIVTDTQIHAINTKTKKRCGLGADDANGIYIALHMLRKIDDLKVVFTVEEEVGAIGAREACFNSKFFEDVGYLLQADRRGSSNLIVHTNGMDVASTEFLTEIQPICEQFGYSHEFGTFTDVGELVEEIQVSGVNISCGYHNEHSAKEHTVIKELENCLNFVYTILKTVGGKYFPHVPSYSYGRTVYHYVQDDIPASHPNPNDYEYPAFDYRLEDYCSQCKDFDCMNCKWYNEY